MEPVTHLRGAFSSAAEGRLTLAGNLSPRRHVTRFCLHRRCEADVRERFCSRLVARSCSLLPLGGGASPGSADGSHLPAASASAKEPFTAIGLEPRHTHSRRHFEPLQDLSRSRIDPTRCGRGFAHWSILLSRSSEVVELALPEAGHLACPVDQRGQGAELRAIVRLATFMAVAHQLFFLATALDC